MLAAGGRAPKASALLAPGFELLENSDFWLHQQEGLAVFAAAGLFRRYRVPSRLDEMVVVSHRFHLAVVQALTRGAAVHVIEPPRMPEPATAAAIFRH